MLPLRLRVFAFQNGDGARSEATALEGIGFVVARQIIAAHGGTFTAHAEGLGFGCEFRARLPLVEIVESDI